MRFNTLLKFSSLLGFAGLVHGSGYRMTFYGLNGNRPSDKAIPACGTDVHYNTDYYIALNKEQYYESQIRKDNPNTASVCDKCAKIMYDGKWVVGRIVDSCPGCPKYGLDVSPKIFEVFAPQKVGVIYMDWEYADCSLLGKSGSGSSGKSSSSNKEDNKDDEKKGNSRNNERKIRTKKTTAMAKKTTVPHKVINKGTKTVGGKTGTKTVTKTRPIGTNIVSANSTNPDNEDIIFEEQIPIENDENEKNNKKEKNDKKEKNEKNEKKEDKKETIEVSNNLEDKDDGNSYVVPVTTGAFVVTGAAGVALLYAKRNSNNINNLKEKFPEAFTNIKRSISRGSTVVRRSLSQSGRKIKRSLSKKSSTNDLRSPVGPQFRTRKEYRDSLNAHYPPIQPIKLYDPPVPSATSYSSVPSAPEYNLQHYRYDANIDRNLNIQIDNNNNSNDQN